MSSAPTPRSVRFQSIARFLKHRLGIASTTLRIRRGSRHAAESRLVSCRPERPCRADRSSARLDQSDRSARSQEFSRAFRNGPLLKSDPIEIISSTISNHSFKDRQWHKRKKNRHQIRSLSLLRHSPVATERLRENGIFCQSASRGLLRFDRGELSAQSRSLSIGSLVPFLGF
jgi:hypothetical protein